MCVFWVMQCILYLSRWKTIPKPLTPFAPLTIIRNQWTILNKQCLRIQAKQAICVSFVRGGGILSSVCTFLAMILFVGLCRTFQTTPPLPCPNSQILTRSSCLSSPIARLYRKNSSIRSFCLSVQSSCLNSFCNRSIQISGILKFKRQDFNPNENRCVCHFHLPIFIVILFGIINGNSR